MGVIASKIREDLDSLNRDIEAKREELNLAKERAKRNDKDLEKALNHVQIAKDHHARATESLAIIERFS